MSLTEKTTHAAESVARLLSQFKGKTKLEGVVSAHAAQAQDEETVFFDLLDILNIDASAGVQLDGIGEIVGEERKGKTDALYRIYLKARILVNKSRGTAPNLNELADFLIDDANAQTYREYYPAAFKITVGDEFPTDVDSVVDLLGDARAGGVRGFLEYTETDDDDTFTFADADVAQFEADQGFGSSDIDTLSNGDFADWTTDDPDDWAVNGESAPNREVSEVGSDEGYGGTGTGSANIYSDSAAAISISQGGASIAGLTYTVRFTITKYTNGPLNLLEDESSTDQNYTSVGVKTFQFVGHAIGSYVLYFGNAAAGSIDVTIDDVRIAGGQWAGVEEA